MFYKPNIVISKCIEHGHCRYDGSMIPSDFVKNLMDHVSFLPFCPEMGIGLPSPRESLRLISENSDVKLKSYIQGIDFTKEMIDYSNSIKPEIDSFNPDGFILKSRSPSCGINDVKVYSSIGKVPPLNFKVKGIFGQKIFDFYPDSIIEDEGRLMNFTIRENFYTVIFTMSDFRNTKKLGTMKALINFHTKNKYLFMAYSQSGLKKLGSIAANHDKKPLNDLFSSYEKQLRYLLSSKPSQNNYINVMFHIFGYFKNDISVHEKAHFLDNLDLYRNKRIPQSAVMGILAVWGVRFQRDYLKNQTIFEPFPRELAIIADSGKGRV